MAAPIKENGEFFKHDKGMRNDPRIRAVRAKFGFEGYGLYNMLLESLTDARGFRLEWSELMIEVWSGDFMMPADRMLEIVDYMVRIGLFCVENDMLKCPKLTERMRIMMEKRASDAERAASKKELSQKQPAKKMFEPIGDGVIAAKTHVIAAITRQEKEEEKEEEEEEEREIALRARAHKSRRQTKKNRQSRFPKTKKNLLPPPGSGGPPIAADEKSMSAETADELIDLMRKFFMAWPANFNRIREQAARSGIGDGPEFEALIRDWALHRVSIRRSVNFRPNEMAADLERWAAKQKNFSNATTRDPRNFADFATDAARALADRQAARRG